MYDDFELNVNIRNKIYTLYYALTTYQVTVKISTVVVQYQGVTLTVNPKPSRY